VADLDPIDRELVEIVLNEPNLVGRVIARVAVASLRDAPLRAILQACYDLYGEGTLPSFDRVTLRLDNPALKSLAAGLLLPIDPAPLREGLGPAPPDRRLEALLAALAERQWKERLRDLKGALEETDRRADPTGYEALENEYLKLNNQRPDSRKLSVF